MRILITKKKLQLVIITYVFILKKKHLRYTFKFPFNYFFSKIIV